MDTNFIYFASMAGIVTGSAIAGYCFARWRYEMADKENSGDDATQVYTCDACGRVIMARLPKGLKGRFVHAACDERDVVLEAEVIGE